MVRIESQLTGCHPPASAILGGSCGAASFLPLFIIVSRDKINLTGKPL